MGEKNSDTSSIASFSTGSELSLPLRPTWDTETIERCRKALVGESIPTDLLKCREARLCIIYGLRHHDSLATAPEVVELCSDLASNADFARARNARLIMSNVVPVMDDPRTRPYCIWHPDVAKPDIYKELAEKYPDMRYQVGRACAVAGYTDLYRSLKLLPDVSIAEEARESGVNGKDIYSDIVSSHVRYAVMDDYTRSVNLDNPRAGAQLNADTAVRSLLNVTLSVDEWVTEITNDFYSRVFDITEDGGIGPETVGELDPPLKPEDIGLLYSPLPYDLPTTNKELLIRTAAYHGNIDRYARLRRPGYRVSGAEAYCVMRGIYHNTFFAKWWAREIDDKEWRINNLNVNPYGVAEAINARFIMSNDLTRITDIDPGNVPYLIWHPIWPRWDTLQELAKRRPDMRPQVVHACIAINYQRQYDEVIGDVKPYHALWVEANNSHNKYYVHDLERRAAEAGIDIKDSVSPRHEGDYVTERDKEPTMSWLWGEIRARNMEMESDGIYYRGFQANSYNIDTFICSPEGLRKHVLGQEGGWDWLYS